MATQNITSASDANEWVLACSAFEQCEIQSLNQDISFVESELIPTDQTEINNMHFITFEPRIFKGNGVDSLWVYINKKDKLRKRPYTIDAFALLKDGYGNPIKSYNGAIDVHDADVHDFPVNEYFHNHTGVVTTISIASLPQDRSVTVASVVGFAPLDYVQIQNGVTESTFPQIISIVGNVLNLDRPLDNGFSVGNTVELISFNMNVDGSVTPVSFKLIPNQGQGWHIVRFLFSMTHESAGDLGLFGNITPLSLPVILRRYDGVTGQYSTFTSWKSNADFKDDMYDVEFDSRSGGQGIYGTSGRGSIKLGTGAVPKLSGAAGDYLEILVQSDLTGLLSFKLKVQGYIVGL